MNNLLMLLLIAAVGGVAVALQGQFMGQMTSQIGAVESVFITYGSGGLLIGLITLAMRGGNLRAWQSVPSYALTAGICGLIIVGALGITTASLGLIAAFSVVLAAQYITSTAVDHFGLFGAATRPLTATRLFGMAVLLLGVWLILRER